MANNEPQLELSEPQLKLSEPQLKQSYLHVIANIPGDIYINGEYRGSKSINIGVEPGTYTVTFGNVNGYVTPLPISATVETGYTTEITVTYGK